MPAGVEGGDIPGLAAMEQRLTTIIADKVGEVRADIAAVDRKLEAHMISAYAHPEAGTEERTQLRTLWDERNYMRGFVRNLLIVGGIVGPFIAAVFVRALELVKFP